MTLEDLAVIGGSTLRVATPLVFAALGGLVSERAGIINIALEGMMLVGACVGAVVGLATGNPWWGFLAAGGAGCALAAVHGLFSIAFRANQVVSGTAVNMLAAGIPPFILSVLYGASGSSPALPLESRFVQAPLWLAVGTLIAVFLWMRGTRSGRWVQFAGEHPGALAVAGISVLKTRWGAVLASGVLAGLGGGALSLFLSSSFSRGMTGGRGFIALAALILGKWKPLPTALACLLFGLCDALQIRLQGMTWGEGRQIPVQFVQILPYVVTLCILAGFLGKARAPKELGTPFTR